MPISPDKLKELQSCLGRFGFGYLRLMWCVPRGDPIQPACNLEKAAFARFLASKPKPSPVGPIKGVHPSTAKVCNFCYFSNNIVSRLKDGKCPICQP